MKGKKKFPVFRAVICAVLAILMAGLNGAVWYFQGYLDNMYTIYEAEGGGAENLTYEEAIAHGNDVSARILQEGSVLLKNENAVLPLSGETKAVNLFGWRSSKMVFGGAGSGFVDDADAVSLPTALGAKNIAVNEDLMKLYTEYNSSDNSSGVGETDFTITELPTASYTDAVMEQAKAFSDTAIITISRMGGEGNDLPTDMSKVGGEAGKHYLELSSDEEAMVKLVSERFDKVILLVNSSHAMELGFIEQYDIDAVLWIGCPGTNGLPGVVSVLTGEVAPSGRLVDTYAYDATSAPSFPNFGDFTYANQNNMFYSNYMEGIYVGYRYYETRGYTDGEDWYRSQVQFPFGYGLSYTTFAQKITSFVNVDGHVTVTVEVQNTGAVAGKDVVQLYYTPPYTPGGIEKSHVNLIGFAKTGVIEAGESETVTINFEVEDMASYDYINAKSYVLEAGAYEVKLMNNAHDVIQSETINVANTITYQGENKRDTDLVAATNQFDAATVKFTDGHTYLSRSDWEGTWPQSSYAPTELSAADLAVVNGDESAAYQVNSDPMLNDYPDTAIAVEHQLTDDEIAQVKQALRAALANNDSALAELDAVEGVTTTDGGSYSALQEGYVKLQNGKLVFALMTNFDYDSPVWELLLSQMNLQEISDLLSQGGYRTAPVDSIEKSVTMDIDGPAGMQPFLGFGIDIKPGVGYPTEVVIASTWNVELAEEMGECVGQFANTQNVSGWYAPAMNGHRSPFAGRNFEYYAEDCFLSGKMAASATRGAREQGIWVYLKHFALNDQELHRDQEGLFTYSNEQAIREIYLKPFEIAVKEGEATGVMSAFNRLGITWAGAHKGLCTEVLRNEWGFHGTVITDFYMNWGSTYMNAQKGILAGNDLYLNPFQGEAVSADALSGSNRLSQAAVKSCKNILYMTSRGNLVNFVAVDSWRPLWLYGNVAGGVLLALAVVWLALGIVKSKKTE